MHSVPLNFQGNGKEKKPSCFCSASSGRPRRQSALAWAWCACARPLPYRPGDAAPAEAERREPSLLGMENQVSLKAEVAELELEAVIGFNGEASSVSGLGGLQAPGTSSANRDRGTPSGTRKAARDTGRAKLSPAPKPWGVTSSLEASRTGMVSQHLKGTRASSPGWSVSRVAVTLLPLVSSALALSPRAAPKAARPSVTAGLQSPGRPLGPRNC